MVWKGKKGRVSKVILFGYSREVVKLRDEGLSYQDIADTLNQRYQENPTISKDTVCRWFKSNTKSTYDDKPIEIVENLQDMFEDIYNELRKSSLSGQERQALLRFIKYREAKLKSKFILSSNLSSGYSSETRKVSDILIKFSMNLCEECRQKTVELLNKN